VDLQKKTLIARERDEDARAIWRAEVAGLAADTLVFVDETGAYPGMTRTYGWAPSDQRAVGRVLRNRGTATTLIASLSLTGMGPSRTFSGATTGDRFVAYLTEQLLPTLRPGQVVILDNVGAHKRREVRSLIEAAGARLLYLPAYSPDFNPIELAFSKLKAILRRVGALTSATVVTAIRDAVDQLTPAEIRNYFIHRGYLPKEQGL